MMNAEELHELRLTHEQEKAAKAVYKAMRNAAKLNVEFWDNYGTLSCYNGNKIARFYMHKEPNTIASHTFDPSYWEQLKNFQAGNADDEIFYELR